MSDTPMVEGFRPVLGWAMEHLEEHGEIPTLVQGALVEVDHDDRVALNIVTFQGHSVEHAAELMGEPSTRVRGRVEDAQRHVIDRLEGADAGPLSSESDGGEGEA